MLVLLRPRVSSRVSGFPVASPCLWGKLQNLFFSKVATKVVMLFCVAGVALWDIPACFIPCRKWQNWRKSRTKCSFWCPSTLYTLHSTLYTVHSTLYKLHTPHSTLYILIILHTLHSALDTLPFTLSLTHPLTHSLTYSLTNCLLHPVHISLTHYQSDTPVHAHAYIHTNSPTITPPSLSYFLSPCCFSVLSLSLEKLFTCGVIRSYNFNCVGTPKLVHNNGNLPKC